MKVYGSKIKALRIRAGRSLRPFAESVGIDPGWLSRIENHGAGTSPERVKRIADALGVDIADIAPIPALDPTSDDDEEEVPAA